MHSKIKRANSARDSTSCVRIPTTTQTPCCSPVYCDLVQAIEKLRQEHRFARIELSIRNHEIIHADLKVETNVRVPMRKAVG